MKLSILIPTFNSASTIERTVRSALAQRHRPLEILVYDEVSQDGTRDLVRHLLDAAPADVATELLCSDRNSGPVRAWRVPLHRATGDWCCYLWADDVMAPDFSEQLMAGAERARGAGRKLVFSSALLEIDGLENSMYSTDHGLLTAAEFSLGMFFHRYSLNQANGVYETAAARRIFDRHIEIPNPYGFDYNRYPYGNDVGFLSELAEEGSGVELIGERLVRLVASTDSMTKHAQSRHPWQFRWQYSYSFFRVWSGWDERGLPAAARLVRLAERRLALCALLMRRQAPTPAAVSMAARALIDHLRRDYSRRQLPLPVYRRWVATLA